jgi:recombination protein RecA
MAPPFREAEFDILYGTGISRDGEIVDLGSEMGVVEKSGAWYSFGGERIGQGREAAKQFLKDHPDIAAQIMAKVMEKSGLKKQGPEAPAPAAEKRAQAKVTQKV